MAKVKPTYILRDIFESFGTPWISRSKHRKPLDVNFQKGSTRLSKRNTPYSTSKTAQKRFFEARFAMLECMWKNLTNWQKLKISEYHAISGTGKSAKSTFFKLGSRFELYKILEFWDFNPTISMVYDDENNVLTITVTLDNAINDQLEQIVNEGEWERVVRAR